MCEIQPVEVVDTCQKSEKTSLALENIFSKIHLSDDLTYEEHQEGQKMVTDIFSTSVTDIGTTDKVKHGIELADETPFKQMYRRMPLSAIEEVSSHIKEL